MPSTPLPKSSAYERLLALPEGLMGEIINGQLRAQPRPVGPHALASPRLGSDLEGPLWTRAWRARWLVDPRRA